MTEILGSVNALILAANGTASGSAATNSSGAATTSQGGLLGTLVTLVPIVLVFVVMYFLMIRPQKKKQKKEEAMRNNIQIGDEIVTISGLYCRVVALKEDSFVVESGPERSKLRVARWAVQQNLTVHD